MTCSFAQLVEDVQPCSECRQGLDTSGRLAWYWPLARDLRSLAVQTGSQLVNSLVLFPASAREGSSVRRSTTHKKVLLLGDICDQIGSKWQSIHVRSYVFEHVLDLLKDRRWTSFPDERMWR